MDWNTIYDDILVLQYKLQAELMPVAARVLLEYPHNKPNSDDNRKLKALAATYELQEYLSGLIDVDANADGAAPNEKNECEPVQKNHFVSDTKVLWQTSVADGPDSDMILLQHADGRYGFDINIGHEFTSRQDEINYLQDILSAFTAWMNENGFDTERTLSFETAYAFDCTYTPLKSVEEVYCMVKMAVKGFCNA